MAHRFVPVGEFTPNNGDWTPIGNIASHHRNGDTFLLNLSQAGMALQVSFLGPSCFRVRFRPAVNPNYNQGLSYAVVEH